jgi:hypothetical protein
MPRSSAKDLIQHPKGDHSRVHGLQAAMSEPHLALCGRLFWLFWTRPIYLSCLQLSKQRPTGGWMKLKRLRWAKKSRHIWIWLISFVLFKLVKMYPQRMLVIFLCATPSINYKWTGLLLVLPVQLVKAGPQQTLPTVRCTTASINYKWTGLLLVLPV